MLKLMTNARTAWVGELQVENKVGADNKPYEAKSILFKVASSRDYAVTKTINGVQTKEKPSDFILCKATGNLAQVVSDYASDKNTEGKIVSRFLELAGHLEIYTSNKVVPVEKTVEIAGKKYNIKFEAQVPVEQSIFIVRELQFLDSTPTKAKVVEATSSSDISITEVSDSAPVTNAAPVQNVTPTANATSPTQNVAPVANAAPESQVSNMNVADTIQLMGDISAPVLNGVDGCPF